MVKNCLMEVPFSCVPFSCEEFVARLFQDQGYRVEFTQVTGDHGIDLFIWKDSNKTAVQCKRWDGSVGEPVVRDFYGSMMSCGADLGIIVSTACFTTPAVAFAANKPVRLIDLDALIEMANLVGENSAAEEKPSLFAD
jgi:restriction system protein